MDAVLQPVRRHIDSIGDEMMVYALWVVGGMLVALLFAAAMQPQQKTPGMKPGQIEITTAEVGREIPVLFGTRILKGSNIVWWGDKKVKAIKVKSGK